MSKKEQNKVYYAKNIILIKILCKKLKEHFFLIQKQFNKRKKIKFNKKLSRSDFFSSLWPMHGKRSAMSMCSFSYLCFLT